MEFKNLNDETKCIITSLLTSNPLQCTVAQLCRDFHSTVGYQIPFERLGFSTIGQYLGSIKDTVKVFGEGPHATVVEVVKEKSAHIKALVSKQKVKVPKHLVRKRKPPAPAVNYTSNWVQRQSQYFREKASSPDAAAVSIPAEPVCDDPEAGPPCNSVDNNKPPDREQRVLDGIDLNHNVPVKIQRNLRELISDFSDGLCCTKMRQMYLRKFGVELRYEKYGYRSLIEMCADLTLIFTCSQSSPDDFIFFDRTKPIPKIQNVSIRPETFDNTVVSQECVVLHDMPKVNWSVSSGLIPPGVVHHSEKVRRYFDLDSIRTGDVLVVCIGEIYDPTKFWIYLRDGGLTNIMDQMQSFFAKRKKSYVIPEVLLDEGLYCVAVYLQAYNRAVIVDLLPNKPNSVKLFFIDYGTTDTVSVRDIYFLPKQYAKLPYQSIRASLAEIFPCFKGAPWSFEAISRFRELSSHVELVAKVDKIDTTRFVLDVYLFNPLHNAEKYLQNILVEEGLALFVDHTPLSCCSDPCIVPKVEHLFLYPDFNELESGAGPTVSQATYICKNFISVDFYMKPYFDVKDDEDVVRIERLHEFMLKNTSSQSFDDVIFNSQKVLILKGDENDKSMKKKSIKLATDGHENVKNIKEYSCNRNRISKLMKDDCGDGGPTIMDDQPIKEEIDLVEGSCNRNRIKELMLNNTTPLNNEEMKLSRITNNLNTSISPLRSDAKEFIPLNNSSSSRNLKKFNLVNSTSLVINNNTKDLMVTPPPESTSYVIQSTPSKPTIRPPPGLVVAAPANVVSEFRGYTTAVFAPLRNDAIKKSLMSHANEIYFNYAKGYGMYQNVFYKSQFK